MNAVLQRPWLLGGGSKVPPGMSLGLSFLTPGTLDPRITFTRGSTATYFDSTGTLQTATTNAPRWDYNPASHVLNGLLIEEARTNLLLRSADLTVAPWNPVSTTITTGLAGAPDGTSTVSRITEVAATAIHYLAQNPTLVASTSYTLSIFAKIAQNSYLQIALDDTSANGAYATFDLQTGVVSQPLAARGTGVIGVATIQAAGNGWYRCAINTTIGAGTAGRAMFILSNSATPGFAPSYAGNAANGLVVWGAQIELGAFPTSYIPTVGSAVARSADVATMPTSTWYASQVGTLSFEALTPVAQSKVRTWLSLETGASRTALTVSATNVINIVDTAAALNLATVAEPIGTVFKSAFAFANGSQRAVTNGGAVTAAALTPMVANATSLALANSPTATANQANGWLRQVRYWPRALSSNELVTVTR